MTTMERLSLTTMERLSLIPHGSSLDDRKKVKKKLIILCVVAVILLVAAVILIPRTRHTVSDFSVYPCDFSKADMIAIDEPGRHIELVRDGQAWSMRVPYSERLDAGAEEQLKHFLNASLLIDEKRDGSESDVLRSENRTKVSFSASGKALCGFELGRGFKLPTVDSERRWILADGMAYRTFIPLTDYGPLFEQPTAGWRSRNWLNLDTDSVQSLEFLTSGEQFRLARTGTKSQANPQGWRMEWAKQGDADIDLSLFILDERRVATVIDLLTPLIVDDWADVSDDVRDAMKFGGALKIGTTAGDHVIYLGQEVDFEKNPEYRRLGEGTRYIRLDEEARVGIINVYRLMGVFPGFDDMRTKHVWQLVTEKFSGIEIRVGESCVRYGACPGGHWCARECGDAQADGAVLKATALGNYLKVLTSLQAVRYATAEERDAVDLNGAEVTVFEGGADGGQYVLRLSEPVKGRYRYAQVVQHKSDGSTVSSGVFLVTEAICRLLLEDLRYAE